jgi:hypothetical protein
MDVWSWIRSGASIAIAIWQTIRAEYLNKKNNELALKYEQVQNEIKTHLIAGGNRPEFRPITSGGLRGFIVFNFSDYAIENVVVSIYSKHINRLTDHTPPDQLQDLYDSLITNFELGTMNPRTSQRANYPDDNNAANPKYLITISWKHGSYSLDVEYEKQEPYPLYILSKWLPNGHKS